jgi:hypothetical protein
MSNQDNMRGLQEGALMTFAEGEKLRKRKQLEQIQKGQLPENMGTDLEKYNAAQRKIQEIIDRSGGEAPLPEQPELRPPIDIENDPYAREVPMPDEQMKLQALKRLRQR